MAKKTKKKPVTTAKEIKVVKLTIAEKEYIKNHLSDPLSDLAIAIGKSADIIKEYRDKVPTVNKRNPKEFLHVINENKNDEDTTIGKFGRKKGPGKFGAVVGTEGACQSTDKF